MDVLALTRSLVAIDSQNPGVGEVAIAAHVLEVARAAGLDARIVEPTPGRPNVLVEVDAGPGPTLALGGHLDTKPVGDARSQWRTDPLELVVDGPRAYGLGSSDMKGAVAAMLVAATRWAATAERGRLRLVLTADEEAGSIHGAEALVAQGAVAADALVLGEPSGVREPWEAIFVASRGIACFEVVVTSQQGHSALADLLPTSATVAAARVVTALAELTPRHVSDARLPASPSVNAGARIHGGVFFGVHPGEATVEAEVRTVPGMRQDELEEDLRAAIGAAVPDDVHWELRWRSDKLGWMPPSIAAPEHPVVDAIAATCEAVLGRRPPLAVYPGGTDATAFTHGAGIATVASVGPGWLTRAHGPNEFVPVADLGLAVDLYEGLAHRFCGSSAGGPGREERS